MTVGWIPTIAFGAIFVFLSLANLFSILLGYWTGKSYSPAVFLGGVCGFIACWTSPWLPARYFCWLPLILDISIPMFVYVFLFTNAFEGAFKRKSRD
jgi:hypothetical protein